MRILTAAAVMLAMMAPAHAMTNDGYITIGGIGSVKCTEYLNQLGLARQAGFQTVQGINAVNPFIQYVFGYLTGYNHGADGMFNIAASLDASTIDQSVLVIIEGYCRDNPDAVYNQGVFFLIDKLLPTAKTGEND